MLCIKDNFLKLYDAFHAVLPICVAGPDCRKGSNWKSFDDIFKNSNLLYLWWHIYFLVITLDVEHATKLRNAYLLGGKSEAM